MRPDSVLRGRSQAILGPERCGWLRGSQVPPATGKGELGTGGALAWRVGVPGFGSQHHKTDTQGPCWAAAAPAHPQQADVVDVGGWLEARVPSHRCDAKHLPRGLRGVQRMGPQHHQACAGVPVGSSRTGQRPQSSSKEGAYPCWPQLRDSSGAAGLLRVTARTRGQELRAWRFVSTQQQ